MKAAGGVLAVHAALLAAVLVRPRVPPADPVAETPRLIDIAEPEPAPLEAEVRAAVAPDTAGRAGRKADPSPIAAPPQRLPSPNDLAAAPVAGAGASSASGAASSGEGPGAGGNGNGPGGGGGGTMAQWVSGGLRDSDYPRAALDRGAAGMVSVRFTVLASGSIANCRVIRSSGFAELDATTCRLLTQRLRFRPATDSAGRPVASELGSDFTWGIRVRR